MHRSKCVLQLVPHPLFPQNAPRWEKYQELTALQRDIMRKFKADRINEKDFDDRWRTFVGHASASWKLTSQDPFGTALSDALRGQIDMMQPRAVFERLTTHQLDVVATALGIVPHHVSWPRLKRWVRLSLLRPRVAGKNPWQEHPPDRLPFSPTRRGCQQN
eukprot:m.902006 g.902006  ORF g.902006 m.902006 type:complete len:161 (-) comp23689_c3_seq16:180-662(-)